MRRASAPLLALALAATGCTWDWDALHSQSSVDASLDVRTDAMTDRGADAPADRATPDVADVPDALDVVDASDVTDVSDVLDASDAADVRDASDASDVTDASDVFDASDATDASDVLDASDATDASDVLDASDAADVRDAADVPDVTDAPVDLGPPVCTGAPATCPCSATNAGGYCRPGESCTGGACVAGTLAGSLVITEIMNDPVFVGDEVGEWVEVYNPGATPLDLRGMRIGNSRAQYATITAAAPVVLAPRAYGVLTRNGDTTMNGNVTPLYTYGTGLATNTLTFSNSAGGDTVVLDLGTSTTEIDRVAYLGAAPWPMTMGRAKSLRPAMLTATANDSAAAWCNAPTQWVSGRDYGSPGVVNPDCP